MKRIAVLLLALILPALTSAPGLAADAPPSPSQLIDDSIAWHDPNGVWQKGRITLRVDTVFSDALAEARGSAGSSSEILLAPSDGDFRFVRESGGHRVEYIYVDGEGRALVDGSVDISDEDRENLGIRSPEFYRDYCEYVYGLPMKLRDPGMRLDPEVQQTDFEGREVWAIRVSYDPGVGTDIWYFYFDPETSALVGSRFHRDETESDGEYIIYGGEVADEASGLRIPATQAWYTHADREFLATDTIRELRVEMP